MRKLMIIGLLGATFWLWREGKLPGFSTPGAYDDNGNPVVLVFTFADCGNPCVEGLRELKSRRVPFEELLIATQDDSDSNFVRWQQLGRGAFPFIVAGKEKVAGTSTADLATLLGNNFGTQYLTSIEKRYFQQHFYADGSPKVVMYGADWCPHCKRLREEMQSAGVDFLEIDVEKSGEKELLCSTLEINGYPATWVGYKRVRGTTLSAVKSYL